jgi:hypothetical protein
MKQGTEMICWGLAAIWKRAAVRERTGQGQHSNSLPLMKWTVGGHNREAQIYFFFGTKVVVQQTWNHLIKTKYNNEARTVSFVLSSYGCGHTRLPRERFAVAEAEVEDELASKYRAIP